MVKRYATYTERDKKRVTIAYLDAVQAGDAEHVRQIAQNPLFNPDGLAVVDSVSWSERGYPASAVMIAATNNNAPMLRLLHELGACMRPRNKNNDPLMVVSECSDRASVPTLKALLKLDSGAAREIDRLSLALLKVVIHTNGPMIAFEKMKLLLDAGALPYYSTPKLGDVPTVALARLNRQPNFISGINCLSSAMGNHPQALPLAARLGLSVGLPNKP